MNQESKNNVDASLGDRIAIMQEATKLYLEEESRFTVPNLAKRLEVDSADIYAYYPNKGAILDGYYPLLVERYRAMIDEIDNFREYDLAEKTSNFIYATLDMMMEDRAFVEETFESRVLNTSSDPPFQDEVKSLFKQFFSKDSKIASSSQLLMQDLFYDFLVQQYFQIISFWLEDSSEDGEKSMAYADKMTSFLQEVMYTSVLDKGMDLFKFMAQNDKRFTRIPILGTITRKILS